MLVALFDSELLCSPPSNRATKRLACVGFVWQADMGDEYDIIIIIITTTTPTPTPTATATAAATATATATAAAASTTTTTATRSINSTRLIVRAGSARLRFARFRLRFARFPRVMRVCVLRGFRECFCAGSARVVAFKFLKEINILRRILLLGNLYIITLVTLRTFTWKTWEP